MTTSWTDEEYGTVAQALLFPASRMAVVVVGFSPNYLVARELDARLVQLNEPGKALALSQARAINAAQGELLLRALGCAASKLSVLKVGDITLDPRTGITQARSLIAEARELLARAVDFVVNPNAALGSPGGVSGTWCP